MAQRAPDRVRRVLQATHAVAVFIDAACGGVPLGEAFVLARLTNGGSATVRELHAAFRHKRSTLTGILDRLETRRLIRRAVSSADRRSFVVTLTAAGKRAAVPVAAAFDQLERALAGTVRSADLLGFDRALDALVTATHKAAPAQRAKRAG